ncbi:MAG: hypothetical protein DRP84_06105 [Spirochaetes bacterium]|nr:MAG: hypothetical protein DRP84_06105 [Spirochaetota bacterium]
MKRILGIGFIYGAAILIMFSILFLFNIIRFNHAYSTAALGFLFYIAGVFLTREGKLTPYKIGMIVLAIVLIVLAIIREIV